MASRKNSAFKQTKAAAEAAARELSKHGQTWIVVYRPRTGSFDEYPLSAVNAAPFGEPTKLSSIWQGGGPESSLGVYRKDEFGWTPLVGLDGRTRRVRKGEDVGAALAYFGAENRGKRLLLSLSPPLPARDRSRRSSRDAKDDVWLALSKAAERIAAAEYRAGRYRPERRRGKVIRGYTLSEAHRTVLKAMDDLGRDRISPEQAMSVLHEYDVLKARTR